MPIKMPPKWDLNTKMRVSTCACGWDISLVYMYIQGLDPIFIETKSIAFQQGASKLWYFFPFKCSAIIIIEAPRSTLNISFKRVTKII